MAKHTFSRLNNEHKAFTQFATAVIQPLLEQGRDLEATASVSKVLHLLKCCS